MYRVLTGNGSRTTTELVEMAVQSGVPVKSLSVQNTTLDDVFVHYTGRQLRDELQKVVCLCDAATAGVAAMRIGRASGFRLSASGKSRYSRLADAGSRIVGSL